MMVFVENWRDCLEMMGFVEFGGARRIENGPEVELSREVVS
jgi:hypothetical protein